MAQIVLDYAGVPKSALVDGAYEFCGLNGQEYERTPEEMSTGLKRLNSLMALLKKKGIDLGYNAPIYGNGLLEEGSGIPADATEAVSALLAKRLAPTLGAQLTAEATAIAAGALSDLMAHYTLPPPSRCPTVRMRSAGRRAYGSITTLQPSDCDGDDPGDLAGML